MSLRTILVDDEPLARERVRTLLAGAGDVEIVGECGDGRSAVALVEQEQPDLLFLDIQMPEMDGFDVLRALDEAPPAVVFVTAYDEYALRAFEFAAVDYLLKPIDPERFAEALARARTRVQAEPAGDNAVVARLLAHLRDGTPGRERFVVRNGDEVSFVRAADIEWAEATGNYVKLFDGKRAHVVRETMRSVEASLDPAKFIRIHRSVLIQIDCIASMQPHFHGQWVVLMRDGSKFISSRTYSERLRQLMK